MLRSIQPRLRTPVGALVVGTVIAAAGVPSYGWSGPLRIELIVVAGAVMYYVWAGRDTDYAAMLRGQADERQTLRRLKMQALVGVVMTMAAMVAFVVAFAVKAPTWPFVIFIIIPGVMYPAGFLILRERGGADASPDTPDR